MLDFLADFDVLHGTSKSPLLGKDPPAGLVPEFLIYGQSNDYGICLEIAVFSAAEQPLAPTLKKAWQWRDPRRANPMILVVIYGDHASIYGPQTETPLEYPNLDIKRVERLCQSVLLLPGSDAALRLLQDTLPSLETPLAGITNEGMLSAHTLETYPSHCPGADWTHASTKATCALGQTDDALVRALGFTQERLDNMTNILRAGDEKTAVAVMLRPEEAPQTGNPRFNHDSPVSYAMTKASSEGLKWVVIVQGQRIRLYATDKIGISHRGRTATFIECQTALLNEDYAGLLWRVFSAEALCHAGTFGNILEASKDYAVDVAKRLRARVYNTVVPELATGINAARGITTPSKDDLALSFEMALTVLFRLLFISYAEDRALLPYKTNDLYKKNALKTKARSLVENPNNATVFEGRDHWDAVKWLFDAVSEGRREWGVPAYNGAMFSSDPEVSPAGAELAKITLDNNYFERALRAMLITDTAEGQDGPVDFRDLSVREFGTIYEGLLESELSCAEQDLTEDAKGTYLPAGDADTVIVPMGEVYLHDRSGARKASGSYYTPDFAVEHLLDGALEPALDAHLAHVEQLSLEQGDTAAAGAAFFAFSVADIAMGSGHFLVAAIDRIERRFSEWLAANHLPLVMRELADLRDTACTEIEQQLDSKQVIEDGQLLRRQIARRCIYGVDMNPLAVSLARLAIWIHTFVPGLPLSLLDHHLVRGNALVGVATLDDIRQKFDEEEGNLFEANADSLLGQATDSLKKLAKLNDASLDDIKKAREYHAAIQDNIAPTKALCDLITAQPVAHDKRLQSFIFADWESLRDNIQNHTALRIARDSLRPLDSLHFPVAFPEVFLRDKPGFNVILGNPPWEEVMVSEDKFWGLHRPGLSGLSPGDQEGLKNELRQSRPDLIKLLEKEISRAEMTRKFLHVGDFPGMGIGDADLYKAFCWRFVHLTRVDGRFGVVLPRSALNAKGSALFRKALLTAAADIDALTLLNNKKWVFPIHPQFTIALLNIAKGENPAGETQNGARITLRGPFASRQLFDSGKAHPTDPFTVGDVMSWNDTASFPQLPHPDSLDVLSQLRRAPRLDFDDGVGWRAVPYTELNATAQKPLMDLQSETCPDGFWPVYKGASFNIWQPDTGRFNGWADPDKVLPWLQAKRLRSHRSSGDSAHGEFARDYLLDESTLAPFRARVAFRDITNRTNTRTIIPALIPPRVFITNTGPYLLFSRGDACDTAFLLGVLSSITLDWYARRFVETHLSFFIFNPLPIPRPDRANPLWQRVVALAGRLACPDARFADWAAAVGVDCGPLDPADKDAMINELDAVVAHLYGLNPDQLTHIFETFHTGWHHQPRLTEVQKFYAKWRG